MARRTYFDHAASSPTLPVAVAAMARTLGVPGNPSSLHTAGRDARRVLEEARESLAADMGALPGEVVFTSGGTEANNLALLGSVTAQRPQVAASAIEHPSVAAAAGRLEVLALPVSPSGHLDVEMAAALVGPRTAVVSVMWVNNETGAVQPIPQAVALAHDVGARAHSDAVQAFGHLPLHFGKSGLDLLSVSAHKLGGPVGIGALVVRRGVALAPSGFGGGQEARVRSGTVPVALAAGFAAASRAVLLQRDAEAVRLAALRDRLITGALTTIDDVVSNTVAPSGPAIVNLTFAGTRADDVLLLLDAAGIDASTGSACTAGVHQPSEVLLAMGRSDAAAASSLRFSFGPDSSTATLDHLLAVLPGIVERARRADLHSSGSTAKGN